MGKLDELIEALGPGATAPVPVPVKKEKEKKEPEKPLTKKDKFDALRAVEKSLNKQLNTTTSLVRLGDKVGKKIPSLSGDLPSFDEEAIGCGGLPKGRIIEWFGEESSGKTTLALHYVAKEQARGGICAYIDVEHALNPDYMNSLGVNVEDLVVSQPESMEDALEILEALVDSELVSLIVLDSVAALCPRAELEGESGDSCMGLVARLMGQAMRKLRGKCAVNGIPVIFINQTRTSLGQTYGDPTVTPGGKALKFFSTLRVRISKIGGDNGKIKNGNDIIGHKIKLNVVKNKVGVPARTTEVDLIYGVGLDTFADLISYAVKIKVIEQKGSWLYFNGKSITQGLASLIALAREDSELTAQIKNAIADKIKAEKEL